MLAGQELRAAAPDVCQSWEHDYASLKTALSNRANPYARLRKGAERKDVAHIQSLIWESDRTPVDVALRRIMLWLDLNAMRLGTPTLDADQQRAQETGEGPYPWPPEMDPKNPTGVEHDRPVAGSSERKLADAMFFEGGASAGLPPGDQSLQTNAWGKNIAGQ